MAKIHELDELLINQIAAGEVVERPISVVKELVENSLDAGAQYITVSIENGGKTSIEIRDDGEWIDPEDLEIILQKHTTSKIRSGEDLQKILTFGFRGEALSSIASVSKLHIISKTPQENTAFSLQYELGNKIITPCAGERGTIITVQDLFFSTPARLHYLKTEKTEYTKILDYLHAVTLQYPEVGLTFLSDGKTILKMNAGETLQTRIHTLFWKEFLENMLTLDMEIPGFRISGMVSHPKMHFWNKNKQFLFVNRRPITSPLIAKAILDSYNRYIPHGMHSAYVVSITLDPTQIDVNVHPRKQEIRFAQEQYIFRNVYHSLADTLEKALLTNTTPEPQQHISSSQYTPTYHTSNGTQFHAYSPYREKTFSPTQTKIGEALEFTQAFLSTEQNSSQKTAFIDDSKSGDLHYTPLGKIIGQAFASYILVEQEGKLVIFDQHAVAERVIYEKLSEKNITMSSQKLLIPENIRLSWGEWSFFEEHIQIFRDMGFECELLSHGMIAIHSVPDFMKKENVQEIISGILQDVMAGNIQKSRTLEEVRNKIHAYTACRSAIKFGNKLNLFEMHALLQDALEYYSATCPHGRPVVFEMSLDELKKRYER